MRVASISEVLNLSRKTSLDEFIEKVKPIVNAVRERGDEALIEFTEKFDGVKLESIQVAEEEVEEAYEVVDDGLIDALETAKENIVCKDVFWT